MVAIIDYDAGNLTSVKRALDFLDIENEITPDPQRIVKADRVIFPGVGHAASATATLKARGLDDAIKEVYESGTPLMGICLGTQIVLSHSEEGDTPCLGLIDGEVLKFNLNNKSLKIPHMGWNEVNVKKDHFLLKDIKKGDEFYFVHSFYPNPSKDEFVFATAEYETVFACAIGCKNLFATQFHPEKSGELGLQILRNFAQWDGTAC